MKYQAVLFDLDGTLTDPKVGITKSIAYALTKFGIFEENLDTYIPFIGPPLKESFMKYYFSGNAEKADRAVSYYREYFSDQGLFENRLYPHTQSVLSTLSKTSLLGIATSKPLAFTIRILKHFKIHTYFQVVSGATLDGTRSNKADVIAHALNQVPKIAKPAVVMIGDRKHDIEGAFANKIDALGVTYGYGSHKEIEAAKPTYISNSLAEIIPILES